MYTGLCVPACLHTCSFKADFYFQLISSYEYRECIHHCANAVCIITSHVVHSRPCMAVDLIHGSPNPLSTKIKSQDTVVDFGSE